MSDTIGYLGLGNMGRPMAGRMLEAGHPLVVRDVNEAAIRPLVERQARPVATARELADQTDVVFASLPTNGAIREAVLGEDGLIEGSRMAIYVNAGTTGTPFAIEITEALAAKGVVTLEAPISGGPAGARAGTLSVMVSGPREAFERVKPCFEAFGSKVVYCGDKPGLAQVLKLSNNILNAVSWVATSEALAMGVKAGLDPEVMIEAIAAGSGRNGVIDEVMPRHILPRTFDYGAALATLAKDVDLALAEGEAQGVPQFVCQQARQVIKVAMHKGWGGRDVSELTKLIEEWAGVEIKGGG